MVKKIIYNIILIIIGYIEPYIILNHYQNNINEMKVIQNTLLSIMFLGSILLIYFNYKNIKKSANKKWVWLIFEIIGVIGFFYSGFILWLLFIFRNGIGF